MTNEISMVSSDLWIEIDVRLFEIFLKSFELSFARSSVLIIGDYPQVPQVRGTLIFPIFTSGKNMNKLFPLSCVRIEENETKISVKKGSIHPSIRENLFSVALT